MESSWYLFPGQTLENTKISDRAHALHITKKEWGKITKHLDRKKIIQETLDKEEAKRKYLNEGSKAMIETWENSLENIRKRKEEERLKIFEQRKQERAERFFQLTQQQEKTRKEYVQKAHRKIFEMTGVAKELTSAYIMSDLMYGRERQKEHQNMIKDHYDEEDENIAKAMIEADQNMVKKDAENDRVWRENEKKYKDCIKKTVDENAKTRAERKAEMATKEALDNILAAKEMELIQKNAEEEHLKKKAELAEINRKNLSDKMEHQNQLAREEKELDEVIAIYNTAKDRIECLKKEKDKQEKADRNAKMELITKLVAADKGNMEEIEEQRLQKAVKERNDTEDARLKSKENLQANMKKQRLEDRNKYLEKQREKEKKEIELKKWQKLNLYKSAATMEKYEKQKKVDQWNKTLERRAEILEQIKEDKEAAAQEKEIERIMSQKTTFAEDDKRYFEYADEILDLAEKKGRPIYPIKKAIHEYKKNNNLLEPCGDVLCEDYTKGNKKSLAKEVGTTPFNKYRKCKCSHTK